MKIIAAGISRTGTMSLQAALERLDFHTYHGMAGALENYEKGHIEMWNAFLEGTGSLDWHKLLEGYDAAVDLPIAEYYAEALAAFPEARVILTLRDPDKWYESVAKLWKTQMAKNKTLTFLPRFREFERLGRNCIRIICGGNIEDRERAIAYFSQHNAAVKATVPPDRLLIFDVKDGWKPLCDFLGLPVPDEPFPHENAGTANMEAILKKIFISDLSKIALPILAGLVVVAIVVIYLLTR